MKSITHSLDKQVKPQTPDLLNLNPKPKPKMKTRTDLTSSDANLNSKLLANL
jgi:hypothetical protein